MVQNWKLHKETFKLSRLEQIRGANLCCSGGCSFSVSFILSLLRFMCRQSGEREAQLSYLACHLSPNHLKHQSPAKDFPLSSPSLPFSLSSVFCSLRLRCKRCSVSGYRTRIGIWAAAHNVAKKALEFYFSDVSPTAHICCAACIC